MKYKQDNLRNYWDEHDYFIASVDEDHPFSPLQPPRGYGGVAIVWKRSLTRIHRPVLRSPDIVATELTIEGKVLLCISVYMPCRGKRDADTQFSRVLDHLYQILQDHINIPILLGGDWNSSLTRNPPEPRDIKLRQFITQNHLTTLPIPPHVPTFMHHNKKDQSQIDYLFTRSLPPATPPCVRELPLGTSDHRAVTACIIIRVPPANPSVDAAGLQPADDGRQVTRPYPKIDWNKVDLTKYRMGITVPPLSSTFTESMLDLVELAKSLRKASELASPNPTPSRSKFRLSSPEIQEAARHKNVCYALWKADGSPVSPTASRDHLTEAKSLLRRTLRREFRRREDTRVLKINEARHDNRALMFKLIRPHSHSGETEVLTFNGMSLSDPDSIRNAWLGHYAAQVTPEARNDEYFNMVEADYDLLVHLSSLNDIPVYQAELRDVIQATQSLNTRKAPDMWGLQAEHIRYGGSEVLQYILIMVNLIFRWRLIPRFLKEGILSSVYKNKPPITEPSNHRGITVTMVIAKVVENLMLKPTYILPQSPLQCGFTPSSCMANTTGYLRGPPHCTYTICCLPGCQSGI